MRRRRPKETLQINVRLDVGLVRELEALAKEHRTTLSEEIRARIIESFDPEPSLWDYLDGFGRRVREIIETDARKDPEVAKNIATSWPILQTVDTKSRSYYTDMENTLPVENPKVRELLRGAVTDDTA